MSVPRFFALVDRVDGRARLSADDVHHLAHVLRLAAGAEVQVFDGRGGEWSGRVESVARDGATVRLIAAVAAVAEPAIAMTVAVGLLKGDEMDLVIRDATMLGAAAIVPLLTAHVVAPRRARAEHAGPRWQRIAMASARQSRRAVVPAIEAPTPFGSFMHERQGQTVLMCVEPSALPVEPMGSLAALRPAMAGSVRPDVVLLIGPEGGWAADEIALARAHGAHLLRLGPRTLRAEAAPSVALAAIWSVWGWEADPPLA